MGKAVRSVLTGSLPRAVEASTAMRHAPSRQERLRQKVCMSPRVFLLSITVASASPSVELLLDRPIHGLSFGRAQSASTMSERECLWLVGATAGAWPP